MTFSILITNEYFNIAKKYIFKMNIMNYNKPIHSNKSITYELKSSGDITVLIKHDSDSSSYGKPLWLCDS